MILGRRRARAGRSASENQTAFTNKAASDATSATSKTGRGEMSNSTSALAGGVVVSIWLMAPVAVELKDSKCGESNVANFFRGPLIENKAQGSQMIKLEVREEPPP